MHQLATSAIAPVPVRTEPSAPLTRPPAIFDRVARGTAARSDGSMEALTGVRLVLVWLGMLAASWTVAVALGYGAFAILHLLAG